MRLVAILLKRMMIKVAIQVITIELVIGSPSQIGSA